MLELLAKLTKFVSSSDDQTFVISVLQNSQVNFNPIVDKILANKAAKMKRKSTIQDGCVSCYVATDFWCSRDVIGPT